MTAYILKKYKCMWSSNYKVSYLNLLHPSPNDHPQLLCTSNKIKRFYSNNTQVRARNVGTCKTV